MATPLPRPPTVPAAAPAALSERFAIDLARSLPAAGAGLPAFAARPRDEAAPVPLIALLVPAALPPRADLPDAAAVDLPGVMLPLAQGPAAGPAGRPGWFVIGPAPPGPPLWPAGGGGGTPWTESELLRDVIAPAAAALAGLRARGLTHRAVRPDNLFRAQGRRAVLGCAWATPPAWLQPAWAEPPASAMCLPAGRGAGSIADDVYALGATALALALGRPPCAGLAEAEIIGRKLEQGSFAALAGGARLPAALGELLRAMLADDPAQRPPPEALMQPAAARSLRAAARPPRRAAHALMVGERAAWDPRTLAFGIARTPAAGARLLRSGAVDHWLRRSLDDAALAARVEEQARRHPADAAAGPARDDALLAMRAVALLDPQAPLCWGGIALWPDGLGPARAAAGADGPAAALLDELVAAEATAAFAALRDGPDDSAAARRQARLQRDLLRRRGWSGGAARLCYALNPLLPCRSARLGDALVVRPAEVLPALDATLPAAPAAPFLLDAELVAFLAARLPDRLEPLFAAFAPDQPPERQPLAQLRLLAQVPHRAPAPPRLTAALAEAARPALDTWRSRTLREQRQALLAEALAAGDFDRLVAALDDPAARQADRAGWQAAIAEAARIDAALAALDDAAPARAASLRALGREVAASLALAALAASAVAAALG